MTDLEKVKAKVSKYMKRHNLQYVYFYATEQSGEIVVKVRTTDFTELEAVKKNGRTTFRVDGEIQSINS